MPTTITTTLTSTPPPRFQLSSLPPFPSDVSTAPLLRLSLSKLLANDTGEVTRFTTACEDLGFFYLDLSAPPPQSSSSPPTSAAVEHEYLGSKLLTQADALFQVGEELYDLPVEEKTKYDFMDKGSYFGYKGFGANVVDASGRRDRNEFYNVSKDDILSLSAPWPSPTVLTNSRPLLTSFMTNAHGVITHLLTLLNTHLHLPPGILPNLHRLRHASGDQVRFIKSPPRLNPLSEHQLSLGEHTDFGSVTLLFNRLGGLQVLPPGKGAEWTYVQPLANHAIVNLGDAMVKFTNGRLRSNIHRVVEPPGDQRTCTRYSLVYFARPENGVLMKRLADGDVGDEGEDGKRMIPQLEEGTVEEEITAEQWIIRRALGHRHAIHGDKANRFEGILGTERVSRRDR